jgi:hypothetical protein
MCLKFHETIASARDTVAIATCVISSSHLGPRIFAPRKSCREKLQGKAAGSGEKLQGQD